MKNGPFVCRSGKVVLDSLNIDVEVYYASETDPSAVIVSENRHHGTVQHVGDVCKLTAAKV